MYPLRAQSAETPLQQHSSEPLKPVLLGEYGPAQLACVRSWGKLGFKPGFIGITPNNKARIYSRYLDDHVLLPRQSLYTSGGLDTIMAFLERFHADGVTCLSEYHMLWLRRSAAALRHNLPALQLWLPETGVIERLLSKIYQLQLAQKAGLDLLPTHYLPHGDSGERIGDFAFPLVLRPSRGDNVSPPFKVQVIETPSQLHAFLRTVQHSEPLIAQPLINGPNLVVHGACTRDGRVFGLQAFRVEDKFEGLSLSMTPVSMPDALAGPCAEFVRAAHITGSFHFEFIVDPNNKKMYFLELNARFGGTTAKAYRCGYDEPAMALAAYGAAQEPEVHLQSIVVANKKAIFRCIWAVLRGNLRTIDYPPLNRWRKSFRLLRGLVAWKDETWMRADALGTAFYQVQNAREKVSAMHPHGQKAADK